MDRKKLVALFMIVFTVLASSFAFYFFQVINTPNILVDAQEEKYFAIKPGYTLDSIRNDLYDLGYLQDAVSFGFWAKIKNYDNRVKPGMYLLQPDMSNNRVINLFASGTQTPVKVIFSVSRKLEELPAKIAPFLSASEQDLANVMLKDRTFSKYGFTKENFISMFIPNTYEVYWTISPEEFLDRMKKEYDSFWNDQRVQQATDLGLTKEQVSTLASIVESETKKMDEAPKVAGLYLNRLKRGIALQADPTLVFALNDFTIRRVLDKDKSVDSPYNTYLNKGLPPGPISLPSIAAIDAVLNFEKHQFLYMCAKADFSGYHAFATNLIDHNKNAQDFQRALNREKIYR